MISSELLFFCVMYAGGYLAVVSAIFEGMARLLNISRGLPAELLEKMTWMWFFMTFVIELMFFVVIPTMAFGFFDAILPLTSVRTALAVALCAFTLGALPLVMSLSVKVKLPIPFLIYSLFGLLIKLGGTLAIIGYMYSM